MVLAAIGLYGVLSYGTTRRRGEIAVRIALGAQPNGIISMILRETAVLVIAGLLLGMALAYGATRLLASQVYGIDPQDPLMLTSAVFVLTLVALVSTYVPALRVSRLDPMTALRRE